MSFPINLKLSANFSTPIVCDETPLDLSIKSRLLKRSLNSPTVTSQNTTQNNSSAFFKAQKRPHVSYQFEKTAVEWAIPKPPAAKLSRQTKNTDTQREPTKAAPHLGYNAAQEGLQKAAEHLKKYAGQSLQAFLKAAYCFEQAAVSATSLKGDADAREYLEKAVASRSIARMAENLALLENIVAEGFLRDAEKMHSRCKLNEILRTRTNHEILND